MDSCTQPAAWISYTLCLGCHCLIILFKNWNVWECVGGTEGRSDCIQILQSNLWLQSPPPLLESKVGLQRQKQSCGTLRSLCREISFRSTGLPLVFFKVNNRLCNRPPDIFVSTPTFDTVVTTGLYAVSQVRHNTPAIATSAYLTLFCKEHIHDIMTCLIPPPFATWWVFECHKGPLAYVANLWGCDFWTFWTWGCQSTSYFLASFLTVRWRAEALCWKHLAKHKFTMLLKIISPEIFKWILYSDFHRILVQVMCMSYGMYMVRYGQLLVAWHAYCTKHSDTNTSSKTIACTLYNCVAHCLS